MSVRIRLRRVGRKKQPYYRLVVANASAPRDGAYIDMLGHYNPRTRPAQLRIDLTKVEYWLGQGAELTKTADSLIRKARKGGDERVAVSPLTQPAEGTSPVTPAEAQAGEREAEPAAPQSKPSPGAEPAEALTAAAPVAPETPTVAEADEALGEAPAPAEGAEPGPEAQDERAE